MSLGERVEMSEDLINKACELSMKSHECCDESKHYLYEECRSSPATVFAFAGAWSVSDWFSGTSYGETQIDLSLFPCLKSIGTLEIALVNEAFLRRFQGIFENSAFSIQVDGAVKEGKQVVFTGHASGGPLAIFATLWFLEKFTRTDCIATPRCVTFGSPLVGNRILHHAIKRENWTPYFIHFVMRYDIVPRIMLAPFWSIEQELQKVLDYFNPKSIFYKHSCISLSNETTSFVENVLTKVSSLASYVACNLTRSTNALAEKLSNFIKLSPYRPFGTYMFCTENNKMVMLRNSDAVLQLLFHFSLLCSEDQEGAKSAGEHLKESFLYENIFKHNLDIQNLVYLDPGFMKREMAMLNDLGLSLRAKLRLQAALEYEEKKLRNEEKIDKESIKEKLSWLQEYRRHCELRKVGYYNARKIKANEQDFYANVTGLQLGGIWNEIIEMIKNYELPDEFEGKEEWIDLGTKLRRLDEPQAIASYYSRGLNDDAGPFMINGRSNVFKFTQRWLEHKENLPPQSLSESCFWAEVEELIIIGKKMSYEDLEERIISLERQISQWDEAQVLGKDVFLEKTTLTQWWNSLPSKHKSESCIRRLFSKK